MSIEKETVVVNLTRLHLLGAVIFMLSAAVVWPTVFYVRTSSALEQLQDADRRHDGILNAHAVQISALDRGGTAGSAAKLQAENNLLLQQSRIQADQERLIADHEARLRLLEKTLTEMGRDLRWLVENQRK
ncbi:MAG: hypothetical protein KIT44_07930 [Opitutaceae bacterium]|nr:hypothetical protein [Opitutaceae bacterium]